MSIDLNIFWAKSKNNGAEYLSLLQHSRDISWVISDVCASLTSPATREFLQTALQNVPLDAVLKLAAAAHDCGKLSLFFQRKVPQLSLRAESAGYRGVATPQQMSANPHSIISAHTLIDWLEQITGKPLGNITKRFWFYIIAGHHGTFNDLDRPSDDLAQEIRLWPEWLEARFELLDTLTLELELESELQDLATIFDDADEDLIPIAVAALITGILISADWVASAEENFSLTNGEPHSQEDRRAEAKTRMKLGGHWNPSPINEADFINRFSLPESAIMRNVQRAVVNLGHAQTRPAFTIIENETGSGKTEAALALAEITAAKLGFTGLFFAQPTRVTSDAIFGRVAEWLTTAAPTAPISTVLAHGKAEFNDEFKEITSGSFSPIYDDTGQGRPLEATQWFQGRKTGLLASVAVGTIDQILFAALQSKHNVLRHLGLAGKVVIIDEIHAADAYMRIYTTRLLEWLGLYGVPVIALSATLPPATRKELIHAYHEGASHYDGSAPQLDESGIYPRITWTDGHTTESLAPEHDGLNRTTHFSFADGDLEEMAEKALELSSDGGCIGIICSTVSRAQTLYDMISSRESATVLLHSRFLTTDRVKLESTLVRQLGRKAGTSRPEKLIVVSTQIIEQGLDLDFDALISDIAPTDLIIQRIGRLHRHPSLNDARPDSLKKPTLTIFGAGIPDIEGPTPVIQDGSRRVYRRAPLLRSICVLSKHDKASEGTITTPTDVEKLVSMSYNKKRAAPVGWVDAWDSAHVEERKFEKNQITDAARSRISEPLSGNLAGWSRSLSPADEQSNAKQVRDADESFEVVVVRNLNGRLYTLPHVRELEGHALDDVMEIDRALARTLATCTVRLPGWALSDSDLRDLEADGQESWQYSRWLKGALPLVLDEDLTREVDRYVFRYDEELGLLMERKENTTMSFSKAKKGGNDD